VNSKRRLLRLKVGPKKSPRGRQFGSQISFLSTFSQLDRELEKLEQHSVILQANVRSLMTLKEGSDDNQVCPEPDTLFL
jgi:hypothetical protein